MEPMPQPDLDRRLAALASLGGPLRRALYRSVTSRDGGVGRDEAAAAVGVSRALAAYHLDKLVEAGMLETRFERRTGRRGPGADRTAKLYLRSASPVEVALPARDYELMAGLLARAVEADPSGGAGSALDRAARAMGAEVAAERGDDAEVASVLDDRGTSRTRTRGCCGCATAPSGGWPKPTGTWSATPTWPSWRGSSRATGAAARGRCWSPGRGAAASPSSDRRRAVRVR